jgi:hypothetical protein
MVSEAPYCSMSPTTELSIQIFWDMVYRHRRLETSLEPLLEEQILYQQNCDLEIYIHSAAGLCGARPIIWKAVCNILL